MRYFLYETKITINQGDNMKRIFFLAFVCILSACNSNNGSRTYGYQTRPHSIGGPTNPTRPFDNSVINSNAIITGMVSRNDAQIADYIKYRLNEWDFYNPNTGSDIQNIDIANAALWLTDGTKTNAEIEQKFADNITLLHMALYVIDNKLNSCFSNASVSSAATCFTNWRDKNKTAFDSISKEIFLNATPINVADAQMVAANDAQIKLIVGSDGRISGATVTENGVTTKYNAWANLSNNEQYAILDKLSYASVGKVLGLSYSDFGTYSIEREKIDKQTNTESTEIILSDIPFAGGYNSHEIAKSDIENNVHFEGRAVGNATKDTQRVYLVGDATLDFDKTTGTSTLDASFYNWYDIIVKDNGEIEFSNYTNPNGLVKLDAVPDSHHIITDSGAKMNVGYYAPKPDTGMPTEATGLVQYTETASGVKMDVAFGAK